MIAPRTDSRPRRDYIDWARGLAVLVMIEAHTTDAWTRAASKKSDAFRDAAILGGFAAPMFLWLAGVALALAAARVARGKGPLAAADTICRRGLEIFILAFLFRLQAFIVTPGSHPVTLFRVDILNVMGPAIVAAGMIWGLNRTRGGVVASLTIATTATAMLTPLIRTSPAVDMLPTWLQWYVRPSADHATFTLFPWVGFVFAGGACGALIAAADDLKSERRLQAMFAAIGAALLALGYVASGRPSMYRGSSFWTTSPTWFAMRVGILMLGLSVVYACARLAAHRGIRGEALGRLGRHSLLIYWVHVELVYGYATWPIHRRLPLWGTMVAFVVFTALMYRVIDLRDRLVSAWRMMFHRFFAASTALGK